MELNCQRAQLAECERLARYSEDKRKKLRCSKKEAPAGKMSNYSEKLMYWEDKREVLLHWEREALAKKMLGYSEEQREGLTYQRGQLARSKGLAS